MSQRDGDTMSAEDFVAMVDGQSRRYRVTTEDDPIPPPVKRSREHPERDFQAEVQSLAKVHGWMDWHVLHSKGMRAGFPDLVLIRPPRILWIELKAEKGKLTDPQEEFFNLLRECEAEAYIWWPKDWDEIIEVLSSGNLDETTGL